MWSYEVSIFLVFDLRDFPTRVFKFSNVNSRWHKCAAVAGILSHLIFEGMGLVSINRFPLGVKTLYLIRKHSF
jgi:hypothetical protein